MINKGSIATIFGLFLAFTLCLALVACQPEPSEPASKASSTTPSGKAASTSQPAAKKQPELLKASQKAVFENLEITLLSAKATKEYINAPKAGNKYIVVRFKTKNIGKEEIDGDISSDLQWLDKDRGTRSGPERTTGIKLNNPKDDKLAPGAEAEFEREYAVPESLTEVEFHYIAGYNPIEKARWMLGIQ